MAISINVNGRVDHYHHNAPNHDGHEDRLLHTIDRKVDQILAKVSETPDGGATTEGYFTSLSIFDGKQLLFTLKGKLNIMALSLLDTQQASGVLTFKDKKLAITDVPDGAVTLEVTDTNVATATYEDSTNTVTVVAGQPGVAALKIKATNAAGADIPFEDIAIEVKSGDAASGGVEFGAPTEQP